MIARAALMLARHGGICGAPQMMTGAPQMIGARPK
jgi:hypothetical protein